MLQKLFGVGAIASAILIWFTRELIKAAFFDRVLHMVGPGAGLLLEYGPPIALAALGIYLLLRTNVGARAHSPRQMLSIVMMIGGLGVAAVGALIHRAEFGHFPFMGGSEGVDHSLKGGPAPKMADGPSLDGTIKLECLNEAFQLPADGKLLELVVHSTDSQPASFQSHWLSEYAYRERPDIIPTRNGWIDKCRVTNFGGVPIFNVKIPLSIQFSEHIKKTEIMTEQRNIATRPLEIVLPAQHADSDSITESVRQAANL